MSPKDFLSKLNWEGGLFEGFTYGLRVEDLDNSDPDFNEIINKYQSEFIKFKNYQQLTEQLLMACEHDFQEFDGGEGD